MRAALPMILPVLALQAQIQITDGPTSYQVAYKDGLEALKAGQHRKALEAFRRAVHFQPKPTREARGAGFSYFAYYPYLQIARCAVALEDWAVAREALLTSKNHRVEPDAEWQAIKRDLDRRYQEKLAATAPPTADPKPVVPPAVPPTLPTVDVAKGVDPKPPEPKPQDSQPQDSKPQEPNSLVAQAEDLNRNQALPATTERPSASKVPSEPLATAKVPPRAATVEPSTGLLQGPQSPQNPQGSAQVPGPSGLPSPGWLMVGGGVVALGFFLTRRLRRRNTGTNPYGVSLIGAPVDLERPGTSRHRGGLDSAMATRDIHGLGGGSGPTIPQQFGPYTTVRFLGRGGCASTYQARREPDGLPVALKVPHPHIVEDPDFRARFRREAALGVLLDHPRIVRILDQSPAEDDPWLVMTFVAGITLEQHIKAKSPLPLAQAIHIASDIAEAMAHAHGKGVVHRDLKPANVMLGENGAMVLDFGIARLTDTHTTRTEVFIGTPAYCSPESLVNARVGPPADRYALGIMLFEMVSGRLPFVAETTFHVLEMHRNDALPDLASLRPEAPSRLVRLVERLCHKQPGDRPEDGEVVEILAELKAHHPLAK